MTKLTNHVRKSVLEPMAALWSPPFGVDATKAQAEYDVGLKDFNEPALRHAMACLRRNHEGPNWPSVFTIRKYAGQWVEQKGAGPGESLASYTFRRGPEIAKQFEELHSNLYAQARAEEWHMDLRCAVNERAHVVAQLEYQGDQSSEVIVPQADVEIFQARAKSRRDYHARTQGRAGRQQSLGAALPLVRQALADPPGAAPAADLPAEEVGP